MSVFSDNTTHISDRVSGTRSINTWLFKKVTVVFGAEHSSDLVILPSYSGPVVFSELVKLLIFFEILKLQDTE